jgi:hypothetical protein
MRHGKVVATGFERVSAVGKRALVSAQVRITLGHLFCVLFGTLAWMGNSLLGEQGSAHEGGNELHDERLRVEYRERRWSVATGMGLLVLRLSNSSVFPVLYPRSYRSVDMFVH